MSTQKLQLEVTLTSQSDWDVWYHRLELKSISLSVWDLLTPEPPTTVDAAATAAPATQTLLTEPHLPDLEDPLYERKYRVFALDLKRYEAQQKALQVISDFIGQTVSGSLSRLLLKKKHTAKDQIAALYKRFNQSTAQMKRQAREAWRTALQPPKKQGLEVWINNLLAAHATLTEFELSEAENTSAVEALLASVGPIAPTGWVERVVSRMIKNKEVIFEDILVQFGQECQLVNALRGYQPQTGAFVATTDQPKQKPVEKACLCGEMHRFSACLYLHPSLRPSDWKANQQIHDSINKKLADSWKLRKSVENSTKYVKKPESAQNKPDQPSNASTGIEIKKAFATSSTAGTFSVQNHDHFERLRDSWIYDTGSDVHVTNSRMAFTETRQVQNEWLAAGSQKVKIEAYGEVVIPISGPEKTEFIKLTNVAYVPDFLTNLVSNKLLKSRGVYLNTRDNVLFSDDEPVFARLRELNGHLFVNFGHDTPMELFQSSAFAVTSATPRKPITAAENRWHQALGHPGPDVMKHLVKAVDGVKGVEHGPTTIECQTCALSKAHAIVSRRSNQNEIQAINPFDRVCFDFIQMDRAYNGMEWGLHLVDQISHAHWFWPLRRRKEVVPHLRAFILLVKNQHGRNVKCFRSDNDWALLGAPYRELTQEFGVITESSAASTQAQNGRAEHAGKMIVQKARTLRGPLPHDLWPEVMEAAVYLLNRTPTRALAVEDEGKLRYRTPFEALYGHKPSLAHIRPYGCKAYPLIRNIPHRMKLQYRAHIGYLVGYHSTNIFQIWVPSQQAVIRTRDVTFDETDFYDPRSVDLAILQPIQHFVSTIEPDSAAEPDEDIWETVLQETVQQPVETPVPDAISPSETEKITMKKPVKPWSGQPTPSPEASPSQSNTQNETATAAPPVNPRTPSPTPDIDFPETENSQFDLLPPSSPTQLTGASQTLPSQSRRVNVAPRANTISADVDTANILPNRRTRRRNAALAVAQLAEGQFHASFAGGSRTVVRIATPCLQSQKPCEKEINTLISKEAFNWASKESADQQGVLPLVWVLKYKFDEDGYLKKFKARICVRGDLQPTPEETFAATAAMRVFRYFMSIIAAYDLETAQADMVNAFINPNIDKQTFVQAPDGFSQGTDIWELLKALYGLKQSPYLWYQHLTNTLLDIGLVPVNGCNCLYKDPNGTLLVMYYVDDLIYAATATDELRAFERKISKIYETNFLGPASWFLGVRILRDRSQRKLWLVQDAYIKRLITKFNIVTTHKYQTPMRPDNMAPREGTQAQPDFVNLYQQKVGSLNWPAVVTRPDIAFAASQLARFMSNPSNEHMAAADRALAYLASTPTLAIEYSSDAMESAFKVYETDVKVYSDSAFADNIDTRRSSYGSLFLLHNGAIDWKAARQSTVTTSSTEAELLALSQTARDLVAFMRLMKSAGYPATTPEIYCDNQQTIRLLKAPDAQLTTKLRHVDIHRHWLRQEVQQGRLVPQWIKTSEMAADGLTKPLATDAYKRFVQQLRLVDIGTKLAP
ncbi:reverse transcriptase family protein [Ceratocystis lukuohia]|uniref:Reverse transcriptase family protein n=1 Tax=Ceratocystis lukuohia TaxID=2019550 RepID=A0ABR4MGU5_9PEZI